MLYHILIIFFAYYLWPAHANVNAHWNMLNVILSSSEHFHRLYPPKRSLCN